jgi:carboxyl-terminal processing protease
MPAGGHRLYWSQILFFMHLSRLIAALALTAAIASPADLTPQRQDLNVKSFEYAWKTIRDRYWGTMPVDWQQVHDELLPKVENAKTMPEARAAMIEMIDRLKLTHFNIIPSEVYDTLGDAVHPGKGGIGEPGFDVRVLENQAIVTEVENGSPAAAAGIKPGWRLVKVSETEVAPIIKKVGDAYKDKTTRELYLSRSILARFRGGAGDKVAAEFLNGQNQAVNIDVVLKEPRGHESTFGFLPTQYVWFESRKIGNTGYVRFNMFMDPARISSLFGDAVESCEKCDGFIIDLRGNPGGLGAMSMGMAGWFIDRPNQELGVMKMKGNELKFVVTPRADTFKGPLAILVDGDTGSTAEIFAEGLKDLGRARVFGTRSAGAALPSLFERLPNGDGFQYAIANYISADGKPLEGIGVIPDVEVKLTRQALLDGDHPVVDAAVKWIAQQRSGK